jgi:hypothetical protein
MTIDSRNRLAAVFSLAALIGVGVLVSSLTDWKTGTVLIVMGVVLLLIAGGLLAFGRSRN